jgi:hypothetical protein
MARPSLWDKIPDWVVGICFLVTVSAAVAFVVYVFCNDIVLKHLDDFIGANYIWVLVVAAVGILLWNMNTQFGHVNTQFGHVNAQFGHVNAQFGHVNARLDDLEEVFHGRLDNNDESIRLVRIQAQYGATAIK